MELSVSNHLMSIQHHIHKDQVQCRYHDYCMVEHLHTLELHMFFQTNLPYTRKCWELCIVRACFDHKKNKQKKRKEEARTREYEKNKIEEKQRDLVLTQNNYQYS
jgi:hypothetical protein